MKLITFLAVLLLPCLTAAQPAFDTLLLRDTSVRIEHPYGYEPHYVLEERARKEGMDKAQNDIDNGVLMLHQYYRDRIDPRRVKVTRKLIRDRYGLRFTPLTGSVSIQLMGYRYRAKLYMEERFGEQFWNRLEVEIDSIMKATYPENE